MPGPHRALIPRKLVRDVAKSPASAAQFDSANVAGVFALRARGEIDMQATKEAGLLAQGIDVVHDV